jgi:hypothetical protein
MRQAMHQAMHNISKMTLKNMLGDTSYWHWCCVVTLGADVGVGFVLALLVLVLMLMLMLTLMPMLMLLLVVL